MKAHQEQFQSIGSEKKEKIKGEVFEAENSWINAGHPRGKWNKASKGIEVPNDPRFAPSRTTSL